MSPQDLQPPGPEEILKYAWGKGTMLINITLQLKVDKHVVGIH